MHADHDVHRQLQDTSAAIVDIARMIEENKALQRNLDAVAQERIRRGADIAAQQVRMGQMIERLDRLLL